MIVWKGRKFQYMKHFFKAAAETVGARIPGGNHARFVWCNGAPLAVKPGEAQLPEAPAAEEPEADEPVADEPAAYEPADGAKDDESPKPKLTVFQKLLASVGPGMHEFRLNKKYPFDVELREDGEFLGLTLFTSMSALEAGLCLFCVDLVGLL